MDRIYVAERKMCPAEDVSVEADPDRAQTILIVEDETLVRMATAEHLRDAGYIVVEAATGEEAQAVLEAGVPVSLIFSDVNMPDAIDGLLAALNDAGIMARPSWTLMHRLPMYRSSPRGGLSVAEELERRIVSLPSSAALGR